MKKKVILIHGPIQSGKTTFANVLKGELEKVGKTVTIENFSNSLKDICKEVFHPLIELLRIECYPLLTEDRWYEDKHPVQRILLQVVGTDLIRNKVDENFWTKKLNEKIEKIESDFVIIPDYRFPNEKSILEIEGHDTFVIKIATNSRVENVEGVKGHASETALYGTSDNYAVWNIAGISYLEEVAKRLVNGHKWFKKEVEQETLIDQSLVEMLKTELKDQLVDLVEQFGIDSIVSEKSLKEQRETVPKILDFLSSVPPSDFGVKKHLTSTPPSEKVIQESNFNLEGQTGENPVPHSQTGDCLTTVPPLFFYHSHCPVVSAAPGNHFAQTMEPLPESTWTYNDTSIYSNVTLPYLKFNKTEDDAFELFVELPGCDKESIILTIKNQILEIESVRKRDNKKSWFAVQIPNDCHNPLSRFQNGELLVRFEKTFLPSQIKIS